jgi:hypothetical protein
MNIKIIHFLFLVFVLVSCDQTPVTTDHSIPKDELNQVIEEANKDDLNAIKRLIAHYDDSVPGYKIMYEKWTDKARSLGDVQELHNYSRQLLTGAYGEIDKKKKSEMLSSALMYEKRAYSNNQDENKKNNLKDTIDEINREINRIK